MIQNCYIWHIVEVPLFFYLQISNTLFSITYLFYIIILNIVQ